MIIDVSHQYLWPPRDEFADRQREARRTSTRLRQQNAFTYGNNSLNPNLLPSSSSLRHRTRGGNQVKLANVSPFHPDYNAESSSTSSSLSSSDDDEAIDSSLACHPTQPSLYSNEREDADDNIPLSLSVRRAQTTGNTALVVPRLRGVVETIPVVRLRRGSEGFEVRPVLITRFDEDDPFEDDEEEDEEEQDMIDDDGDRIRRGDVGDRYRRYIPQVDADSDVDDS
jgi:hypothetical protein